MRAAATALAHGRDTPDTLRVWGRLDLAQPVVLSVPDTYGRYYALWLRDTSGAVFASLGARTPGTAAGAFAVIGPDVTGVHLPAGMTAIVAPTRSAQLAGCIEAVGETDEALRDVRGGFGLV